MRTSPSIVPGIDPDVFLVLDDFGRMGCAWRETNVEDTDLEAVIQDLLEGHGSRIWLQPLGRVGSDVSEEIARRLRQH